ncbi:hypothetical protein ACMYR3_06040 [Ampullimonas aquatilis]|uniref:hypothetical protein n=1 Tax=Ampullimonas aquatilis TaxID=1341549 RepID=UPI003C74169B
MILILTGTDMVSAAQIANYICASHSFANLMQMSKYIHTFGSTIASLYTFRNAIISGPRTPEQLAYARKLQIPIWHIMGPDDTPEAQPPDRVIIPITNSLQSIIDQVDNWLTEAYESSHASRSITQ